MKQKIVTFDIIIPEAIEFYGSTVKEQKVRGNIRIVTLEPVKMSKIELQFKGQIDLKWKKTNGLFREQMSASKTFKKFNRILLQDGILPSGVNVLDFEISIPGYICPSFQSRFCQIRYNVSAKLMMPSKFQKNKSVHKSVHVRKTLFPKDISVITDFRVPQQELAGKRSGVLGWFFQIPQWVCLGDLLEFDGVFHGFSSCVKINKIQLDVVQEERYFYDVSCTDFKRRLLTNANLPSTYLDPPLDTPIRFSFPLACKKKEKDLIGKKNQDIQKDNFNHTLESPFLTICHFARLLIHLQNGLSICIGVPFKVTPHLKPMYDNDLPSYYTALKEGKKLPSYSTVINNDYSYNSCENTFIIPADRAEGYQRQQQRNNNNLQIIQEINGTGVMVVGERNIEEFCAI